MSVPFASVLHATYMRPQKAVAAMRLWFERAANPKGVEYIFACNADDSSWGECFKLALESPFHSQIDFTAQNFAGSAPAWNAAAKISHGQILIQAQDDVEPPQDWDAMLLEWLEGANVDTDHWRKVPTVVAVRDGYRRDRLLCTAICNRLRYEQVGHFLCPDFLSVFSDDDFSYNAYRDERNGKCMVVRADLEFRHEHHYHNPSVPMDATYARENSSEAYRIGAALFAKRNPQAATDGIRDWH